VSDPTFTGERLHAGSELFRLDLARHQVAYEFARTHMGAGWVLDLGCGSGRPRSPRGTRPWRGSTG
jgi:hypothetical protein